MNAPSSSWQAPLGQNPSASGVQPDWFEAILPPSAMLLVVLLWLTLPVFLLTAESLFAPLYDVIRSVLFPINGSGISFTQFPIILLAKIALFLLISITGIGLLTLKTKCLYTEVWSMFLPPPSHQHSAYNPDQKNSMVALVNWMLFRFFSVFGPVLGWLLAGIIVGAIWYWAFNLFSGFGFLTFQIQFTLGLFVLMVIGWFALLEALKVANRFVGSSLGDMAAMLEPEKPAQVIYDRVQRLGFISPWQLLFYPLNALFSLAVLIEMVFLLVKVDIDALLSFQPIIVPVYSLCAITLVVFLLLNSLKLLTYHDAMQRYYRKFID